jgi:formate hydrogenlyase transcriptional activator
MSCATNLARRLGKPIKGFNGRSIERLRQYPWPGNVRELQNVVERAAILSPGPVLDLGDALSGGGVPVPAADPHAAAARFTGLARTLEEVERSHIASVLRTTGGVVGGTRGAAAILGLHPNTLRSRMKKLGIAARLR